MPTEFADELIASIRQFPSRFKEAVLQLALSDGPFPLYHPDLFHSNVIVDDAYHILTIIDWEKASTVPWETVGFPMFLYTVPPPIDLPSKYDDDGRPFDSEIQGRWRARQEYVESVRKAEIWKGLDCKLSLTLSSCEIQNLATSQTL